MNKNITFYQLCSMYVSIQMQYTLGKEEHVHKMSGEIKHRQQSISSLHIHEQQCHMNFGKIS